MNREESILRAALQSGLTFELPPTRLFEFVELVTAVDAAELRRLHAVNEELLEALKQHVQLHDSDCICQNCAAIAKAGEQA